MTLSVPYASIGVVPRLGTGVPFIARDAELAQLRGALERARSGSPGAVLVSGDAGVGKSRLLTEFLAEAAEGGARVLLGRCLGVGEAGLPYLPFKEIVEQLRLERDDLVAERPALTGLIGRGPIVSPGPADETSFGQLQLFDAILTVLAELAQESPLVLALEDLHWADPSSRDLLSFLLSRLADHRLLVIATYRSDDLHRQHPLRPLLAELVRLPSVERLDLAPFTTADALAFVEVLADGSIEPTALADVAARSEGNAFFAEELVAASTSGAGGIPTALADVLMARVETLSPAAQRVVGAVSVTGRRHVGHGALRAVVDLDDDELDAALREALQHHILVTTDRDGYTFRHALLREAVYADLLPGERVRLHAAYARRIVELGQDELAAALAHHSLRSNDLPTALAASVRAADDAMRIGALAAELRHVEQALELWSAVDDPESRAGVDELALTRRAADIATAAGHPERALAYAQAAVAVADRGSEPATRADTRRQLTESLLANGRWNEASRTIGEAWELIADAPPSAVSSWVLALQARTSWVADDDLSRAFAERAVEDARSSGTPAAEADALISLAFTELRTGAIEPACEQFEEARRIALSADAPLVEQRAVFNLVTTRYEQGLLDLAAEIADDAAVRAGQLGLTWSTYGLELRWMRAMVHYARGSWDDSMAAASPPGEQVSDTITALLAASAAIIKVGRGRFEEAERDLVRVRPEWHRDSQIPQLAGIAGAEMACWQGRHDPAVTVVQEALESMRKSSSSGWPLGGIRLAALGVGAQADAARQARATGDADAEARAVAAGTQLAEYGLTTAERGMPRADTLGPEGLAWLARLRAEKARLTGSTDPQPWRDVVEAFGYGEVYHVAMARWRLAETLIAAGDRDGAATELAAALDTSEQLGALPLADAVRELARRANVALPGVVRPVAGLLTPREESVLALVARGYTNRKVGEELFISEKTVSVHLSRVMTKLGAASRTEAVSVAYQRGLLTDPIPK
ncbi:helix-turn-helix transcriptional regulator [Jiangella gansuensis]|uniref:helix-turn-helix transcriptional regulator n=1 Tax=Jiangella gansuensis TaxID=281473 RepID=UPI001B7F7FA4|nr:helix-turn-helix transcriptional regulator [Jiangella gansuensis]